MVDSVADDDSRDSLAKEHERINDDIDHALDVTNDGNQYLIFNLGNEEYGVDLLKVQEIKGWEVPTPIPNMPDHIKGVINLRGDIAPIVDFRTKFATGKEEYDERTVVIMLRIRGRVMGAVVDGVSDVISLQSENMKPAPEFMETISVEYLNGLATVSEIMVVLVDIEKLMSSKEMGVMDLQHADEE